MSQINRILAVLLLVQSALAAAAWWPREASIAEPRDLLGMSVEQVQRVAITGRRDGATEPPAPVVLARGAEGWTIESAEGYPAAANLVDPMLENLGKLTSREVIASKSTSYAGLEVGDDRYTRKIEVTGTDGTSRTVLVGVSSGKESNARIGGEPDVYRVRGLSAFGIADNANRYFDRQLLKLVADTVTAGEVQRPGQAAFSLEKSEDGTWSSPTSDRTVDQSEAKALVGSLGNLRMLEPAGKARTPEMGLENGTVVHLTVDEAGATRSETYRVGAEIPGSTGHMWLVLDSSPFVFKALKGSLQPSLSQDLSAVFAP